MCTIVKDPNLYDLLYDDVTEDINFYLNIAHPYSNILEFGAGTGRVTIPLAKNGHNIVAVDIEQVMLDKLWGKIKNDEVLKEKIKILNGDMCNFIGQLKYDCIIIPFTSFNYLLTQKEQLSCLNTVRDNLSNDGIAVIELLSERTFNDVNSQKRLTYIKDIPIDDKYYYEYWRNTTLNIKERVINQKRVFKLFNNKKEISEKEFIWNNRFVTITDFVDLFNECGLEISTIYGDCKMNEYKNNSEDVFVKVKKR